VNVAFYDVSVHDGSIMCSLCWWNRMY